MQPSRPAGLVVTGFAVFCAACGRPAVAAERFSAAAFEKEMGRAESLWSMGKRVEYFLAAREIIDRFDEMGQKAAADKELARIGVRPLEIMLSRKLKTGDFVDCYLAARYPVEKIDLATGSTSDLTAIGTLAEWIKPRIVNVDENRRFSAVPVESRVRNLMLIADVMGRVRKEIVPDCWDCSIAVPRFSVDIGAPGDPELFETGFATRADRAVEVLVYREEIAARILNERQRSVVSTARYGMPGLADAIVYVLRERKDRSELLRECARRARLNGEEIEGIQKRLEAGAGSEPPSP
jgi:hypothetical protein